MPIPAKWREAFAGATVEQQAIGESQADVFRLRRDREKDLFLKSDRIRPLCELPDEVARLRWMKQLDLPVPTVLDTGTENGRHWLLMSAVAGRDLASASDLTAPQIIRIMAGALRTLHQIPIAQCPFDHNLQQRLSDARERLDAGLIDATDFDDERQGQSAKQLFAELSTTCPNTHDLVVTHGDAYLPNFMADGNRFSGFIDCGRLGVSDRYQDLALAARSISNELGKEWVAPFFQDYGVEPDEARIAFYALLDEFF